MASDTMEVFGGSTTAIDFAPSSVPKEIAQNVRMILTTIKGAVPLDRMFGLNADILDDPSPRALARLVSEIVTTIERYEPRVSVVSVRWVKPADITETADGRLTPRVRIKIKPGVKV